MMFFLEMRFIMAQVCEFFLDPIAVRMNLPNTYNDRSDPLDNSFFNFFDICSRLRSMCSVSWIDSLNFL